MLSKIRDWWQRWLWRRRKRCPYTCPDLLMWQEYGCWLVDCRRGLMREGSCALDIRKGRECLAAGPPKGRE